MNTRPVILTATIGLLTLTTACTPAQVKQFLKADHHKAPAVVVAVDEPVAPAAQVVVTEGLTVAAVAAVADVAAVGSDPPVTECGLPGEHFVVEPWPMCVPDACVNGERWVAGICVAD